MSKGILSGNSLAMQWLRLHTSTAGGTGPIPVHGTKILHATQHGQKNKSILPMFSFALPPTINLIGELFVVMSTFSWSNITIILIGVNIVITALYSLYMLIITQRGKYTYHINNISPSFTRENALISLHILPLLLLTLNPKIILGPLYCKYSLTKTLDCESNNRNSLPSYLPKKYARTANSMLPYLIVWLFRTFKG